VRRRRIHVRRRIRVRRRIHTDSAFDLCQPAEAQSERA
jgi:hypothetical protein